MALFMINFEIGFKGRDYVMSDLVNRVITIYDIAKEAGVSASTVSRVLTNSANVRPEKKERIQAIIDKYNFRPNALARSLSDTKTHILGVVTADVRNPFYAAVFVSVEKAATAAGYQVVLANSMGELDHEIDLLDSFRQQQADAIIQIGGMVDGVTSDERYVDFTRKLVATIPMVVTGKIDHVPCYSVKIDAVEASSLLVQHLIQLGHKKIALVGGRLDVTSTRQKYETFLQIMAENNLPVKDEYIIWGNYTHETGYNGVKKLLGLKEIPTSIIAINDFCAAGVVRGISELGFKIPEDISVVSYDNTYISELLVPKLTSIDYNYDEFGKALVRTAIGAIEGTEIPALQTVTPHLVVKESSGRAKN